MKPILLNTIPIVLPRSAPDSGGIVTGSVPFPQMHWSVVLAIGITFIVCAATWIACVCMFLVALTVVAISQSKNARIRAFVILGGAGFAVAIGLATYLPAVRLIHQKQHAPSGIVRQYDLGFTTLYAHIDSVDEVSFQSFIDYHRLAEMKIQDGSVQTIDSDRRHLGFGNIEKLYLSSGKSMRVYRNGDDFYLAYNVL